MIRKMAISMIMLVMFVSIGCGQGNAARVGDQAIDFTLQTLDGKSVTLSELKGKKVLIDFFATWCPPCLRELKEIEEIVQEHPQDTYKILCISVDRGKSAVESFMQKKGYSMTVLMDTKNIAQQYGVTGIPSLFLINEAGELAWSKPGAQPKERLLKLLGL